MPKILQRKTSDGTKYLVAPPRPSAPPGRGRRTGPDSPAGAGGTPAGALRESRKSARAVGR
jgi:hypothetical protein